MTAIVNPLGRALERLLTGGSLLLLLACSPSEGRNATGEAQAANPGEESLTHLEGRFGKPGALRAEASFKVKREGGKSIEEFAVSLQGAPRGTAHLVKLDGVEIGKLTADLDGEAELEFVGFFPAAFKRPVEGAVVRIGENCEVALQKLVKQVHLESAIAGSGRITGKCSFKIERLGKEVTKEFRLKFAGAPGGSVQKVSLDGVVVGEVKIDSDGEGKFVFSDVEGPAFPATFPELRPLSVLRVGEIVTSELRDRLTTAGQ